MQCPVVFGMFSVALMICKCDQAKLGNELSATTIVHVFTKLSKMAFIQQLVVCDVNVNPPASALSTQYLPLKSFLDIFFSVFMIDARL